MKTTLLNDSDVKRGWVIVDATGQPVGRLAVKIANVLRGKTKPTFAPQSDLGDFVVVINAAKVRLTGAKETQKMYKSFSRFPDGLKHRSAAEVRKKDPGYLISHAVRDMLPKNNLRPRLTTRLKIYAGADHPHVAQAPKAMEQ
jgi:large subunit ribosomal protein L13